MGGSTVGFLKGLQQVPSLVEPTLVPEEQVKALSDVGSLEIRPGKGAWRARPLFVLDLARVSCIFASFTDTVINARTALLERVYYHSVGGVFSAPLTPSTGRINGLLRPFLTQMLPRIRISTPLSPLEFPATYYVGRRLAVYQRALASLLSGGLKRSHAHLKSFLKHEKLLLCTKRLVPRLIQPRSPEYNIMVGCYLRHIEHEIYHAIASVFGGHETVMKGFNTYQVGAFIQEAWGTYHDPVALGLDASRYDQHVNTSLLRWEHTVYQKYYPGDKGLQQLLSWQLLNKGWIRCGDGEIRYQVKGGRCSGDMNTALGNCLIMCGAVYSLCRSVGQPATLRVRLFNNGDDCVIIGERADVLAIRDATIPFFDGLGIVMKVEPLVDVLELVSFCQSQPVYDGARWRMVRDPRVCLSKDVTFLNRTYATTGLSAQLHAIAECGLSLCGGLPLLQAFYTALPRGHSAEHSGPVDPRFFESGMFRLAHGLEPKTFPVTDEARVSFYRAFGLTPDHQVLLEEYYDSLSGLGTTGVHLCAGEYAQLN